MKINIIHNDKSSNVMMDAETMSYIFKRLKQKPKVEHIHINSYKMDDSTVNIYLETFNCYHFSKSKFNIFIPNFQYFHKNWFELTNNFDLIICKTQYCYDIFKDIVPEEKLVNIGWRSIDFSISTIEKEYDQYLVVYNDIYFNDIQKIINVWKLEYPILNIVFNGTSNVNLERRNLANINYIEKLNSGEYEILLNKCIVHFCLDIIDNFNHNIVQCQLVKSVPVIVNKGPSQEVVDLDNCFTVSCNKKKNKGGLGSVYRYSEEELVYTIEKIIQTKPDILDIMGNNCSIVSNKNQNIFLDKVTALFDNVFEKTIKIKFNRKEYKTDELPSISIVTPVYNLPDIFKMSIINYTSSSYPKDKMEWIIVDDSDEGLDVESLLPSHDNRDRFNIRYIRVNEKTDLFQKYNMAVDVACNDVILNMSVDDFFYENGFELIVRELLKSDKKCVGMVQYGCFDINRYISIINITYITLPYYLRLYEGSLCYYRQFWEDTNYGTETMQQFLEGRYSDICEIAYENILIGLIHTRNVDVRRVDDKQEPNGCHFNFTEKLFKYLSTLDKHKLKVEEDRQTEIEEIRAAAANQEMEETNEITENTTEVKEI